MPDRPDLRLGEDHQVYVLGPADRRVDGVFSPGRLRALVAAAVASGIYRSAAAVATAAGMEPPKLHRLMEGGVRNPSIETITNLVLTLECRFVDLLE